jgi:flavin-dependent dehydrogenase
MVLVGDAAGQVKPTTGGGIYYGLLCAEVAADVLHQAISVNDFSAQVLSEYDRRWRRLLSRELQIGRWARWLFERLNDRQIDRLFDMVQRQGFSEALLNSADFSFDWHSRLILRGLRHLGPRAALPVLWLSASSSLPRTSS